MEDILSNRMQTTIRSPGTKEAEYEHLVRESDRSQTRTYWKQYVQCQLFRADASHLTFTFPKKLAIVVYGVSYHAIVTDIHPHNAIFNTKSTTIYLHRCFTENCSTKDCSTIDSKHLGLTEL